MRRHGWLTGAFILLAGGGPARADDPPSSITIDLRCHEPSAPRGDQGTDCKRLQGYHETRVTFHSAANPMLFQEIHSQHYDHGAVHLYLDGNGDLSTFRVMYAGPRSILTEPGLRIRIERARGNGHGAVRWEDVTDLPLRPEALALKTLGGGIDAGTLSSPGTLNAPDNPVDWTQLKNVPADLAGGGVLRGDLAGTLLASRVVALGGLPLGPLGSPSAGQVLRWDGRAWTSGSLGVNDLPDLGNRYVDLQTDQVIGGAKRFTAPVAADITGNAASVTHGLYSNQVYANPPWLTSIAGDKITGSVTESLHAGYADAVTDGLYSTRSYSDPAWLTSVAGSKVIGAVGEAMHAQTVTNGVYSTQSYFDPAWLMSIAGAKVTGAVGEATHAASADTVANGVYTTGDQSIGGRKTFTSPIAADIDGTSASTHALQGVPVATTTPTAGQVLAYDGSSWRPTTASAPTPGGSTPLTLSFAPPYGVATHGQPLYLCAGEFTGDNEPDLLATAYNSSFLTVIENRSGGTALSAVGTVDLGGVQGVKCAVGDFDGDGRSDAIVPTYYGPGGFATSTGNIHLLRATGPGTFARTDIGGLSLASSSGTADLDGDGFLDLVVSGSGGIDIYRGDGAAGFALTEQHREAAIAGQLGTVTIADIDGDGRLDFAVGNDMHAIHLFGQDAGGQYLLRNSLTNDVVPYIAGFARFNSDGLLDLAAGNYGAGGSPNAHVWSGLGGFTFRTPPDALPVNSQPTFGAIADFNQDGRPDYAVASWDDGTVTVFINRDGSGAFDKRVIPFGAGFAGELVAQDFNKDGLPDLALADFTNSRVLIALNNSYTTTRPVIRSGSVSISIGGVFYGVSTSSTAASILYLGALGYAGAKKYCEQIPGAPPTIHMCSAEEMVRTIQMGFRGTPGEAWVASGIVSRGGATANDCSGYQVNSNNFVGATWSGIAPSWSSCSDSHPIACCD